MEQEHPWWAHMMGVIEECERRGVPYPPTTEQYRDWIENPLKTPDKENL